MRRRTAIGLFVAIALVAFALARFYPFRHDDELLIVAYDAAYEYFIEVNRAFSAQHAAGDRRHIQMMHAGSVRQSQNLIRGLIADVAILGAPPDLTRIEQDKGWVARSWRERLPHEASPFSSTIVFLVRSGNPKQVRDWADLYRPGVATLAPSPRVSAAGRLAYLAALGAALDDRNGNHTLARQDVSRLYERVEMPALGARHSLEFFFNQSEADVLLCWENEAHRAVNGAYRGRAEVVYPSSSIEAEPVVAWIDAFVERRGTRSAATEYTRYLFSREGQEIAARHFLRTRAVPPHAALQQIPLFTVAEKFGGWQEAWSDHFGEDSTFSHIELQRRARAGSGEE